MPDCELRVTTDPERAREWALVLSAEGIDAGIVRGEDAAGSYVVLVDESDLARGALSLAAYERERAERRPPRERAREMRGLGPLYASLAVSFAMLAFYAQTGPRAAARMWFAQGSADAARIASGELWRCVTALTLHADLGHVISNALFGAVFLTAAGRSLGPGLACALTLLAGAGGNFANAILRASPHDSVGASTALFGAVGVLAGWRIPQLAREGRTGRRAAAPLAAALGLLAMLGVGGAPIDIWAHGFGLALGLPLGAAAGWLLHEPPARPVQTGLALAAVAAIASCWSVALS
jgi:membrane associated rhomboid family serine protease